MRSAMDRLSSLGGVVGHAVMGCAMVGRAVVGRTVVDAVRQHLRSPVMGQRVVARQGGPEPTPRAHELDGMGRGDGEHATRWVRGAGVGQGRPKVRRLSQGPGQHHPWAKNNHQLSQKMNGAGNLGRGSHPSWTQDTLHSAPSLPENN